MDAVSCMQLIQNKYHLLTAVEKKIADYLLHHQQNVVGMSISELAENAQVAKSAIVRCCKSLGFEGYTQLKLALAADHSKNKQLNYTPYIYPDDSPATIMEKVFSSNVKALHDTAAGLDHSVIQEVLTQLEQARQIYLYGIGTSASMVTELQYRLMQLGYTAFAFTDPGNMMVSTMNIDHRDVAFGISYSGRTIATTQTMELARAAGAKTICITNYPGSPITKVCEYSIPVYCDEVQYPVEAMSAKIAQLSLIYALTTALSSLNQEDTMQRAKRTRELINSIRMEETK